MNKLFRTQGINFRLNEREQLPADNPIELDNKAFDIVDGNKKMLDYLDYSGTIAKGSLAAEGIIKLDPNSYGKYKGDYGAVANPIKKQIPPPIEEEEESEENIDNEWDNIFLNNSSEDENFFMQSTT